MGNATGVLLKITYETGEEVKHAARTVVPVLDLEDWSNTYVKRAKELLLLWATNRGYL